MELLTSLENQLNAAAIDLRQQSESVELPLGAESTPAVRSESRTAEVLPGTTRVNPAALARQQAALVIQPSLSTGLPSAVQSTSAVSGAAAGNPVVSPSQLATVQPLPRPPPYLPTEEYNKLDRAQRSKLAAQRRRYRNLMKTSLPYTISSARAPSSNLRALLEDKRVGGQQICGGTIAAREVVLPETRTQNLSTGSVILVSVDSSHFSASESLLNVSSFFNESPVILQPNLSQPPVLPQAPVQLANLPQAPVQLANVPQSTPILSLPNNAPPAPPSNPSQSIFGSTPTSPTALAQQEPSGNSHPHSSLLPFQQPPSPLVPTTSANLKELFTMCLAYVEGNSSADSILQQVISLKESVSSKKLDQDKVLHLLDSVNNITPLDDRILTLQRERKNLLNRLGNLIDDMINYQKSFPPH